MKPDYKCPWCGMKLANPQSVENHAKDHYITCIEDAASIKSAVVTV